MGADFPCPRRPPGIDQQHNRREPICGGPHPPHPSTFSKEDLRDGHPDLGEIDTQGRLRVTGRTKELFKTGKGKYIAPSVIENKLLIHPDIEQVCVCGAGFPQPHALICPTPAVRRRIGDVAQRAALEASFLAHLAEVNSKLEHHEAVQFFTVVKDDWSIGNGFLTPTLKVKRAAVEKAYDPSSEGWHESGDKIIWQI